MTFDVFISHASEDKIAIVRPLAEALQREGLKVWFDETEIRLGDSLRRKIDDGLARSRFGVVVLSPAFFEKEWPQKELDGLVAREDGSGKVILPIWHNVTHAEVRDFSPPLADKLGAASSKGLEYLVREIVRAISPASDEASSLSKQPRGSQMSALMLRLIDRVTEMAEEGAPMVTGLKTGFQDFDRNTTGLQRGELTLIAGRPLTGKTAFAVRTALSAACEVGVPVVYVTLGTSEANLALRMVGGHGGISAMHLASGRLDNDEWGKLTEAVDRLMRSPMTILDGYDVPLADVLASCRDAQRQYGALGLVVIDALQELDSAGHDGLHQCLSRLRRLARELQCPIIVTLSLLRRVETRADKRPTLADVDDVADLSRVADHVALLYRRQLYSASVNSDDDVEVIVAKQSNGGPLGTLLLTLDPRTGHLSDLVHKTSNGEES